MFWNLVFANGLIQLLAGQEEQRKELERQTQELQRMNQRPLSSTPAPTPYCPHYRRYSNGRCERCGAY